MSSPSLRTETSPGSTSWDCLRLPASLNIDPRRLDFLCFGVSGGAGLEEDWSDEGGEGDEEDERRGEVFVESDVERTEVAIMEIAKPMKLRGALCCCWIVG